MDNSNKNVTLRRALNLPLLVLYGVGVTVGAGIFALIGEVLAGSGDHAPLAFLLAGLIAGATGISYAKLATVYPRAGGEAIYVNSGLGWLAGAFVGYGVTITGIISSAVIAVAFGRYLGTLVPIAPVVLVVLVVVFLAAIACLGVRESVAFAALITVLEVGVLLVVAVFGAPLLTESGSTQKILTLPSDLSVWSAVLSTALLAFFAFVGFEDIVNMAEETHNPERNVPWAVIITLLITILVYALVASVAVLIPDRQSITSSAAPMASVFTAVSGRNGDAISAIAAIAMVNGILVQIVMASRVLYGMTRERLAPAVLGRLHPHRQTPMHGIVLIAVLIVFLALVVPLGTLAKSTSLVILTVFTLVNISLWRIGGQEGAADILRRWRYWGLFSALLCLALLLTNVLSFFMQDVKIVH
jgi:amino acid transporter